MQIPSLQPITVTGNTAPVSSQQQVNLAQASSSGNGQAAAVTPDTANAVTAAGQAQSQQQAANSKQKQPDPKQLQESVNQLNSVASLYNSSLQFSVDKDTGTTVVKVVDTESKQVIRQIPSEEALRIAKAIGDFKGILLKDKA